MIILVEPFGVQKRGCTPEEYEDAFCPPERTELQGDCIRIAVGDGATESVFARQWAERLVNAVVDGELSTRNLSVGIASLRGNWLAWLAEKTLPWFAEEKARQGTFAALVALELNAEKPGDDSDGYWHVAAVGDSCLFQVRGKEVLVRFPLASAEAFDSRPYLISSIGAAEENLKEEMANGTWRKGDIFYLMTDALACWFLKFIDTGGSVLDFDRDFASANGTEPFRACVESLRDQGSIRNDDCTLIRTLIR